MRWHTVASGAGVVLVGLAGSMALTGMVMQAPALAIVFVVAGIAGIVMGALLRRRAATLEAGAAAAGADQSPTTSTTDRLARPVIVALMVMAVGTLAVAVAVGRGQARGHALLHLVTGLVSLGLFAALTQLWHPTAGTGQASLRAFTSWLLVLATFGMFLESMGGAGYDVNNDGRRIQALTTLHDVGLFFGPLFVAVPLALGTLIVVLGARVARLRRHA